MKTQILNLINEKFERTRGGISLIELAEKLQIGQEQLKTELNAMHQEKKIKVRQSINLKIIYPYEQT